MAETVAGIDGLTQAGALFEVVDEDVRGVRVHVFRHRLRSLPDLLLRTRDFEDRTYLVEGDLHLTFGQHLQMVHRLATALGEMVRPGDRVALYTANSWQWIVSFWAVVSVGAIPALYNGWWTEDEFAHATSLVSPELIIGDRARLDRAAAAGATAPVLDLSTMGALLDTESPLPGSGSRLRPGEDDPALLIFTSGTTGRPKAVTISHRGVIGFGQVNEFKEAAGRVAIGASVPSVTEHLPLSDDVVLVTSPLFHTSMLFGVVIRAVARGSTAVLLPGRFAPERVLAAIERERVTSWLALGSAAPRVCSLPGRQSYDTSSLRHVGVGGAPVSPAVQEAIRATFPQVSHTLSMGYASSESVAVVASIAGQEFRAHPTSTGRPTVTTEVQIRDEHGQSLPDGDLGEIHVRSPYTMLGYWNDLEATAAVLKDDGWLAMGDLGRKADGLLYIESRARDMILVNAENVAPTEVEHRLEAHPAVSEAAVLAVDDPVTGDAVCAVVVVGDVPQAPSGDELAGWCRATLAHYKVPTRWHIVQEPLPRTASGKLVKDRIRERIS